MISAANDSGAGGGGNQDDARFARFRDRVYAKWATARDALVETAIGLARGNDLSSLHVTFCTAEEAETLSRRHGLLHRVTQQFHWENRGYASFDDFLAALSSRKRKEAIELEAVRQSTLAPGAPTVPDEDSAYDMLDRITERTQAAAEFARAKARKLPQAQDWNGAVGPKQLAWFEGVAADAARRGLKVVVFAHHPVAPAGSYDAWDATEVLGALGRHRNVVAWFNGHHHDGGFAAVDGLPCVTFRGMVETPDTNAFATARFLEDRVIIAGQGREPSRELVFRV
mgnify:CR=1 FL=1